MRKHLILNLFFCFFWQVAMANDCELMNYKLEGLWTYTQEGVEHSLEFSKGANYLSLDGEQKEYRYCNYYKYLNNSFDVTLKDNYKRLSFKFPKDNSESDNVKVEIGWNTFELTKKRPDAEQVSLGDNNIAEAASLNWTSAIGIDNHLFPSLIIATATWSNEEGQKYFQKTNNEAEYLGDLNSPVKIILKNIEPDSKIKIEVDFGSIAKNGVWEGIVSKPNKTYIVKPRVSFDYQALLNVRQPEPIDVKVTLYVNEEKVGDKFQTITVRSVNDVPLLSFDEKGKLHNDYRNILAAFVNENNPLIDLLLREAINSGVVNSFDGYQSGPSGVYNQVFAIWNVMQRRGMKYSSITTPTGVSNKVVSQYVRFFDDTTLTSQANCIDGTVLFASVLRRIGINSKIVMVPGHAFLAFDLNDKGNVGYLETTLMGSTSLNQLSDRKRLRDIFFDKKTKNEASFASFNDAVNAGFENMTKNRAGFLSKNPQYKFVDIAKARESGISPINK